MPVPRVEYFSSRDFFDFLKDPDHERFLYHEVLMWVVPACEVDHESLARPRRGLNLRFLQSEIIMAKHEGAICCQFRDGNVEGNVYVYLHKNVKADIATHDIANGLRVFVTKLWPKIPWRVRSVQVLVSYPERHIFVWACGKNEEVAAAYLVDFIDQNVQLFPHARLEKPEEHIVLLSTADRSFVLNLLDCTITETRLLDERDVDSSKGG